MVIPSLAIHPAPLNSRIKSKCFSKQLRILFRFTASKMNATHENIVRNNGVEIRIFLALHEFDEPTAESGFQKLNTRIPWFWTFHRKYCVEPGLGRARRLLFSIATQISSSAVCALLSNCVVFVYLYSGRKWKSSDGMVCLSAACAFSLSDRLRLRANIGLFTRARTVERTAHSGIHWNRRADPFHFYNHIIAACSSTSSSRRVFLVSIWRSRNSQLEAKLLCNPIMVSTEYLLKRMKKLINRMQCFGSMIIY